MLVAMVSCEKIDGTWHQGWIRADTWPHLNRHVDICQLGCPVGSWTPSDGPKKLLDGPKSLRPGPGRGSPAPDWERPADPPPLLSWFGSQTPLSQGPNPPSHPGRARNWASGRHPNTWPGPWPRPGQENILPG